MYIYIYLFNNECGMNQPVETLHVRCLSMLIEIRFTNPCQMRWSDPLLQATNYTCNASHGPTEHACPIPRNIKRLEETCFPHRIVIRR